ncbi:neuroguidin [Chelonus insularis]|uniref:neuroguidin n=1 Tax=Chelonus insularis TaxID=460826 RepID=UPI00158F1A97|nr:neuroguidin [Chelonus insularis]
MAGEIINKDSKQLENFLMEMNKNVANVNILVESLSTRTDNGELSTNKGLSFLEMKYHMLLSYLINLTYVMLKKCSGEKIEGDSSIERLVEIRTVLEKIKPIEYKLKYQIEKLVRSAVTGVGTDNADPIKFKANPDALEADSQDSVEEGSDDEGQDGDDNTKQKKGIYVPPKLTAVHYDGDETANEKIRKAEERSRKRAISGAILRELKEEYLDTPAEDSIGRERRVNLDPTIKRKIEYEENYMTRLPVTKQEKHRNRRMTTLNTLGDEITNFTRPNISKKRSLKGKNKKKPTKKRRPHKTGHISFGCQ